MDKIKFRGRRGRPRTRPDAVAGDKAYSSRSNRTYLRKRKIRAVIPEKADQAANRKRRARAEAPRQPRRRAVQGPQHRRGVRQPAAQLARDRHPLRQDSRELPGRTPLVRHDAVATQHRRTCVTSDLGRGSTTGVA
ncbi:hypothetical protein [Actinacidiphila glaucinigra]|uniref:hypothetical protein n=1 Tax=Actinacidiphila glaucinigra TaxID=235986 RepID=UPI00386D3623